MEVSLEQLAQMLQKASHVATLNIADAVDDFIDSPRGPAEMIFKIVSTTESALSPGKKNRIDTGLMAGSGSGDTMIGPDMVIFDFGWLDNPPDYISVQEYGGVSTDRGNPVWPMHALEEMTRAFLNEDGGEGSVWPFIQKAVKTTWFGEYYHG